MDFILYTMHIKIFYIKIKGVLPMKKFWTEFKAFIAKGNVVDLAVAMIIGTAFNKIVSSLVNDIIMPMVSLLVGGKDVTDWKWIIRKAEYDANGNILVAESALKYGIFIQAVIDFLIIALSVFIIVKVFKATRRKVEQVGTAIITETKEITKKQLKALKKLQKKNKKKGIVTEETAQAEPVADNNPTDTEAKAEIESPKPEQEVVKTEEPATKEIQNTTSLHDTELLYVLKEIRDTLKSNQTQENK